MSGSISFNTIPALLRQPLFYAEFDPSRAGVGAIAKRSLLIGQATSVVPAEVTYLPSADQVGEVCGWGSQIARMMRAYRANDPNGEVWVLPLQDNNAGVAATGTVVFTGPATAAGVLALYIGGERVQVGVANADTATAIATATAAAVNADVRLPVTASASSGTVTLTARNKGTAGNHIDIRMNYRGIAAGEQTPAGVGVTITAMSGGAGDPSLATLAATLGEEPYDFICMPWTTSDALDAFQDLMSDVSGRWSYSQQIWGHVWTAARGTSANLITLGESRNDPHTSIFGYDGSPTCPAVVAAAVMGRAAPALIADPARPVWTLQLLGVLPPPRNKRFAFTERETLLNKGISIFRHVQDATTIGRAVVTYQRNAFGQPSTAYYDTHQMYQLMEIIRRTRLPAEQKYARSKLANDGTRFGPGQPIATPATFKAELVAQYVAMEADGLVENAEAFIRNTIVQRNPNDPSRLDVLYAPDLVNALAVIAVLVQFRN
jgi:phage tail sheath gpL-like